MTNNYKIITKDSEVVFEGDDNLLREKISFLYKEGHFNLKIFKNEKEFKFSFENISTYYVLHLMFFKIFDKDYRNEHVIGIFNSFKEAEDFLIVYWFSIHEHWVNTACIEKVKCNQGEIVQFYHSENMTEELPHKIENPTNFKSLLF